MPKKEGMRTYAKAIIGLSVFGALNALYLTVLFVRNKWGAGASSICDFNSGASCSNVITSPYALFLGVPVCTVALMVYPLLAGLGIAALKRAQTRNLFYAASILAAMGLMLNVVYVYNEVAHIKAVCVLCVGCTFIIAAVLFSSVRGYFWSKE